MMVAWPKIRPLNPIVPVHRNTTYQPPQEQAQKHDHGDANKTTPLEQSSEEVAAEQGPEIDEYI